MSSTSTSSETLVQHLRKVRTADRGATMAWVRFGLWLCEAEQAERKAEDILAEVAEQADELLPRGKAYTLSRMSQSRTIAKQYVIDGGQTPESLRDFSLHAAYSWRPSESDMPAAEVVAQKRQGTPPAAAERKAAKGKGKARGKQAKAGKAKAKAKRAEQAEPASGQIADGVNDKAKILVDRSTFNKLNALRSGDDWSEFLNRLADQGRSAGKEPKRDTVSKRNTSTAA